MTAVIARAPLTRQNVAVRAAGTNVINVVPETVDMNLYRGDDFAFQLTVTNADDTPADLTGETAEAQIRQTEDAADPPAATFTCTITTNVITLSLSNTQTRTLPPTGRWDCQLVSSSGSIRTIVRGAVTVTPDVTRP